MPSPQDARKTSAKKSPGAVKDADLGQELAKKRSQDFKAKIASWSGNGAGVVDAEDGVAASADDDEDGGKGGRSAVAARNEKKRAVKSSAEQQEDKENATPKTLGGSPKTPVTAEKGTSKQVSGSKPSREIDYGKKVWVRRRSKAPADGSPDAQQETSPEAKFDTLTPVKTRVSSNVKQKESPTAKPKDSPRRRTKSSPDLAAETSKDTEEVATPKKRIVSDTHWRKDRTANGQTPTKDGEKEKEREIQKPRVVRRSVVSVGLKVPPSVQDFKEPAESKPTRVRPIRRRSHSPSGSVDGKDWRQKTPDFQSSGTKLYIKPRVDRGPAKERNAYDTSESSLTVPSSLDRTGSATDITTSDPPSTADYTPRGNTTTRVKPLRISSEEKSGRARLDKTSSDTEDILRQARRHRSRNHEDEEDVRLPKSVHTAESTSEKAPPRPVPRVFSNRIEGWLAGMPDDPFVEPASTETPRISSRDVYDAARERREARREKLHQARTHGDLRSEDAKDEVRLKDTGPAPVESLPERAPRSSKRAGAGRRSFSPNDDRTIRPSGQHDGVHYRQDEDKARAPGTAPSRDAGDATARDFTPRSSKRHTYAAPDKREFPSTGNRLSTIASVSTLNASKSQAHNEVRSTGSDRHSSFPEESILSRASDGDRPTRNADGLKRRHTKHRDLMSVLSLDKEDNAGASSRRGTRSRRTRPDAARVGDLMNDVSTDELTYQRELRTLVDGVIPVLLQYVVSHTGSDGKREQSLTQPIVEMGVALERLKTSHKRIPMHDSNELLLWAQNTAKVYAEYIKVWRLGFNDIVVNLAPAERKDAAAWDDGIQRNENGDLLDADGERVDVAFLLKRPLVRVKNFSKAFTGISQSQPSAVADNVAAAYQELVTQARQRSNDEQARLEDEAAAAIDPSRARDLRNLAPLGGVSIDATRRVKARDFFDLELFHSNGQQLGCRIEAIIRDDATSRGCSGDILFCEVSPAGRWLLFPPVLRSNASARRAGKDEEIIVMIRGRLANGSEWRELMSLQSSETQGMEWIEMLGSNPLPPKLDRKSSFNALTKASLARRDNASSSTDSDIPIGEQARPSAPQWDGSDVNSVSNGQPPATPHHNFTTSLPSEKRQQQHVRFGANPLETVHRRSQSEWTMTNSSIHENSFSGPLPPSGWDQRYTPGAVDDSNQTRPGLPRRISNLPSKELPTIAKSQNAFTPDRYNRRVESTPVTPTKEPTSAPSKLQKRPLPATPEEPHTPPSRGENTRATSIGGAGATPSFTPTPAFMQKHRRTSSPLKHEYEPSTASESSSDSEVSEADEAESITSDSSADEQISTLGELKDFNSFPPPRAVSQPRPSPLSIPSNETVAPGDSASQRPRSISLGPENGHTRSVACIFSWSDRGTWESLHPQECEIVVMPGVIEAFDLAQFHGASQNPSSNNEPSSANRSVKPLVAIELTPWVPLRRGTAVDISVRSPPMANSVLRNCSNIMFRSRSPGECEKLYNLINQARINNPTWIALQNQRGPVQTSNWAEVMDRRNAERTELSNSPSWLKSLSRKGSTYRSKGTRSASIAGSHASAGTLNSAFSALRQFSGSNRIFNIAKSTIMSKQSTRSSYTDSLSSGVATPLPIDPTMGTPVGISNAKIRLYRRETTTKWRDLGQGRLTIMIPPRRDPSLPADPRITGFEKRVLIYDKAGSVLLDKTLGESCFERIARTGIAVSVWEEGMGANGELGYAAATGGVNSSKSIIYMIQLKSEREAAYTFSMVGKLRY